MHQTQFFLIDPRHQDFMLSPGQPLPTNRAQAEWLLFTPLLVGALLALFAAASDYFNRFLLTLDGLEVPGRVEERWIEYGEDSPDEYHLRFSYVVADHRYEREAEVGEQDYAQLEPGIALTVRYRADDPANGLIDVQSDKRLVLLLGGFLLLAGGGGALSWRDDRRKERALVERGTMLAAALVSARMFDDEGSNMLAVRCRFVPPGANAPIEREVTLRRDDLRDAPLPPPGTPLRVLYLARDNYRLM